MKVNRFTHTTDDRTSTNVVFYRLREKFVDNEKSVPEDVRSVFYYTLAIGHHTGVIDCLRPRLTTSREVYADVLRIVKDSEAHEKLSGIERFGEIEVKNEHIAILKPAIISALTECGGKLPLIENELGSEDAASHPYSDASATALDAHSWLIEFLALLEDIQCEPQVYAMGRRVT